MQALTGSPGQRAAKALAAGCDIALHCSGKLEETRDVLASIQNMPAGTTDRLTRARNMALDARIDLDVPALSAERAALLPC
jgi:beta-N-acetylhexosaminidase